MDASFLATGRRRLLTDRRRVGPELRWFAPIVSMLVFSGCASFSEQPAFPSHAGPSYPIQVQLAVSGRYQVQVGFDDWMDMGSTPLAAAAERAIWDSGWVRRASEGDAASRLEVQVSQFQSAGPGLLSLLTAFVIPAVSDHRVNLEIRSLDARTANSPCSRSVQMRTWYQTFLIFVYPFRSPAWGREKATEAMALDCLAELLGELDAGAQP